MFTKDIPLITKRHYEFIQELLCRFEKMGAEVFRAEGMTYWDFCTHIVSKGPRKGKMFGFPSYISKRCEFKNYSKIPSLENINVGVFDYQDIGIAFDEVDRQNQLTEQKRSILVEKKITEHQAFEICKKNNILSPHYEADIRDGCALCPQANENRRRQWFCDYPEAHTLVLYLQNIIRQNYEGFENANGRMFPLRNQQLFIDLSQPQQLTFFDYGGF